MVLIKFLKGIKIVCDSINEKLLVLGPSLILFFYRKIVNGFLK